MSERPGAGFPYDSTLPLLAAFVLALAFIGVVVAIVGADGEPDAGAATATETETTPRTATTAAEIPLAQVTLVFSAAGDGEGRIRVRGSLRDCTEECRLDYDEGATATLVARPSDGSTFVGWTGECGSALTCRVTMDGSQSLTALFSTDELRAPAEGPDEECSDDFDNDGDGDVDDRDVDCLDGLTEEPLPVVPPPVVTPKPPVTPPLPPPPPVLTPQPPAAP